MRLCLSTTSVYILHATISPSPQPLSYRNYVTELVPDAISATKAYRMLKEKFMWVVVRYYFALPMAFCITLFTQRFVGS
ncbi:MAG: hypothetical protein RMK18_10660 [Armatimonadota bacterium]|nr:hypothetical protein [Armatimonadota bacterium]MDW8026306.1 hypothetical protein [Armatimonadota bacterium]